MARFLMRILVAPDKFKGSLGAGEVAEKIAAGLRELCREAEIICCRWRTVGKGRRGDLRGGAQGQWQTCAVHDPIGRVVEARFCTIARATTAVMEMSEASGCGASRRRSGIRCARVHSARAR